MPVFKIPHRVVSYTAARRRVIGVVCLRIDLIIIIIIIIIIIMIIIMIFINSAPSIKSDALQAKFI